MPVTDWKMVAQTYRKIIEDALDSGQELLVETSDDLGWDRITKEGLDEFEASYTTDEPFITSLEPITMETAKRLGLTPELTEELMNLDQKVREQTK